MGTAIDGDVDLGTHFAYATDPEAPTAEPPVEVEQLLQRGSA